MGGDEDDGMFAVTRHRWTVTRRRFRLIMIPLDSRTLVNLSRPPQCAQSPTARRAGGYMIAQMVVITPMTSRRCKKSEPHEEQGERCQKDPEARHEIA